MKLSYTYNSDQTSDSSLFLLAFGAHPDDVEIGAGGIVAKHALSDHNVGICDLTQSEMSSNGTVESRHIEASESAQILGVNMRIQLQLPDRGLRLEKEMIDRVVDCIRETRPTVILAPHPEDRHPDHGWCARIVREAWFSAGLRNYKTNRDDLAPHRPKHMYYYFINDTHAVPLAIDVTDVYEQKRSALMAYKSQFVRQEDQVETPLNNGIFLSAIEGRDAMFGQQTGCRFAEGLVPAQVLKFSDLNCLL